MPVKEQLLPDAVLFLWTRSPALPEALEVIHAWGFKYRTVGFAWAKVTKNGKPQFGTGHYTRPALELCLLGIRGRPKVLSHSIRQLIMAQRRAHSRKPDLYDDIARLFKGPYLELFARQTRTGWTSLGNEIAKYTMKKQLDASRGEFGDAYHRRLVEYEGAS
jgi:N6-adenosine-specific RNA methylase IME4